MSFSSKRNWAPRVGITASPLILTAGGVFTSRQNRGEFLHTASNQLQSTGVCARKLVAI